ncbi:hypothetical protein BYT27DRAFT_7189763 [Phlegmacium glaucopus]|nr:hypothetical protein BYT27DRAFT_7189763 [Phlegmacium glaucopus]
MGARATVTPFLPQSFFFDWNPPAQPVPIPTTPQCQTINIKWERGTAVGPNPTAPYFLQVYTSTAIVPFVIPAGSGLNFDWAVPFAPDTQYQICMFDSFGNTGGCQATYTMIPPLSTPNCTNVTFPPLLDVRATVDNGPMSQFGWVDQCTDISVLPKNGTAPYTLTIAPALHPPYNITSPNMSSMNWTVSLSWASPFFISLVDSGGSMWSNGPLHSGGGGTIACLAGNISSSPSGLVQPAVVVGSGVGGLVIGLLIGLAATYMLMRRSYKKKLLTDRFVDLASGSPHATGYAHLPHDFQYRSIPTTSTSGINRPTSTPSAIARRMGSGSLQYHIEPFVMPGEDGRLANEARSPTTFEGQHHGTGRPVIMPPEPAVSPPPQQQQSHVYVLHHDSNIPPVTIFHETGTEIVELPPRYPHNTSQSDVLSEDRSRTDSRSDGSRTDPSQSLILGQPRKPARIGKSPRSP